MPIRPTPAILLDRIRRHRDGLHSPPILHYDILTRGLSPWFWPLDQDWALVALENLASHRITHEFRAPCCICAADGASGNYTESAIYIAKRGLYSGRYVVGCASGSCGYLICIEHLYRKPGLVLQQYPARAPGAVIPRPVLYVPTGLSNSRGSPMAPPTIPTLEQPAQLPETTIDLLFRLDAVDRPGLTDGEIENLLGRCPCGLNMTRRAYGGHTCIPSIRVPIVIDLTSDEDDIIDLTLDEDL